MQQLGVALAEQHTQVQDLGNVKQKVFVDDLAKHGRSQEVLLRGRREKITHTEQSSWSLMDDITMIPMTHRGRDSSVWSEKGRSLFWRPG